MARRNGQKEFRDHLIQQAIIITYGIVKPRTLQQLAQVHAAIYQQCLHETNIYYICLHTYQNNIVLQNHKIFTICPNFLLVFPFSPWLPGSPMLSYISMTVSLSSASLVCVFSTTINHLFLFSFLHLPLKIYCNTALLS